MIKEKRALSNIVAWVILILVAITAISLAFLFIPGFLKEQGEIIEIKQNLLLTNVDIKDFDGDLISPATVNITLTRGPGKEIPISVTVNQTAIEGDIVLVSDLSKSMSNNSKINESISASKFFVSEILDKGDIRSQGKKIGLVVFASGFPNASQEDHILSNNSQSLKNTISQWFTPPLVQFYTGPFYKDLDGGGTCICCGIIRAKNQLLDSSQTNPNRDFKTMILMTDGSPENTGESCSPGNPQVSAIQAATDAKAQGIIVNAVGFDVNSTQAANLQQIATAGGGVFYNSEVSQLSATYSQVATQITEQYADKFDHLLVIFYNETTQSELKIYDNLPGPLETKTYTVTVTPPGSITNVKKIEIYPVVFTSTGKKIIGDLLGKIEF